MKKSFFIVTILLIISIFIGCTSHYRRIPRHIANAKTPELNGGSEFMRRTGEHTPEVPNVVFYKGPGNKKQAALTFDDGPDIYYTTKILDILSQNKVKATFFIVGQRAQKHPEMVKRIIQEGHAIGNHTWDHPDLNRLNPLQIRTEVAQTDNILYSITGHHTNIFRPPYGIAHHRIINELAGMGYKVIDWSVDTRDWAGTPPDKIMAYVKKEIKPGGIILEHCAGGKKEKLDNTVKALPQIISYLKGQGYTFVTVPQLLGF